MKTSQVLGLIGSILLFVGAFLPIIKIPIYGSINYFHNGRGDGVIIAGIAIIALILAVIKENMFQIVTALSAGMVMGYTYMTLKNRIEDVKTQMNAELANNPFRGLADNMVEGIQIEYGFGIMAIGVVLLFVCGFIKD